MSFTGWAVREYLRQRSVLTRREQSAQYEHQQRWLKYLLRQLRKTRYGRQLGADEIQSYDDFRSLVPLVDYEGIKPFFSDMLNGVPDITWPGKILWFAKSSGTTSDSSKYLPVSRATLSTAHFKGAFDVMSMYCYHRPHNRVFNGKTLIIGGSLKPHTPGSSIRSGDISAVMMYNQPFLADLLRTPPKAITLMEDFEEKLERAADCCIRQNITGLAGVPTWNIVLLQKILKKTGATHIGEIWPSLELYLHGGVSFEPYQTTFEKLIPLSGMQYWQIYNASEGFFAYQDRPFANDMVLACNHGIFYEFIPQGHYFDDKPPVVSLDNLETGRQYALVISTNSGIWRYIIGDTIEVTSIRPVRIRVTGRIKSYINAFGEEVMVDNTDKAVTRACLLTGAIVKDYTVAPLYFNDSGKASHEWMIEFEQPPQDLQQFTRLLDQALREINSDYDAKRSKDLALTMPVVHVARKGLFYEWLKNHQRLGAQNKVPRLKNDRSLMDVLLKM